MAWEKLNPATAEMSLTTTGIVEWNIAMHVLLGSPDWVGLVWDAAVRRLGIHRMNHKAGFPVYKEPKTGEYLIASAGTLSDAGVSVDSNYSESAPVLWPNDGSYSPHERGTIYFLTIP